MSRKRKSGKGGRVALIILCIFLALILITLVAGAIYVNAMMNLIGKVNKETQTTMSSSEYQEYLDSQTEPSQIEITKNTEPSEETEPTWVASSDPVIQTENVINILLIGQDARKNQGGRQRSDSMILCTVNKTKKTLTMTSFMRDLYVQIPGYRDTRINESYYLGGMELLDECLAVNFGVSVDGNVEIDFYGFIEVIDLLGGVEVELTAAEAKYLNRRGNWDINPASAGKWTLTEGKNRLTGDQALAYSRIREIGSDFERTARQRKVLTEIVDMCKDLNILELNNLLQKLLPMISTDLSNSEILGYALEVFPLLKELEITTQRIPANGAYTNEKIRGMSVLLPNLEKNRAILRESLSDE